MAGSAGSAGSAHPLSSSRKSGGEGGAASDMQAGTNATRTGPQEVVHKDGDGDEDENRETFAIRDDACYVMARACEMFAMDLTKRSELVMEDQKRARFSSQKSDSIALQTEWRQPIADVVNAQQCHERSESALSRDRRERTGTC